METEDLTKLIDATYKDILDKFNPSARQMISAGKAYLKALNGAATASAQYLEAMAKMAKQAQRGTWGDSSDIGAALMQVVEVYKEIQVQQMNTLKAFYVDLLVPLETNLEKDTKVVQSEHKKFLQQQKARTETYAKAVANMKKNRKKGAKGGSKALAADKELKHMQILQEEKSKLGVFCEQSLKNAMTQERRRYGFVLERQCSLAKHYIAHYSAGIASYNRCFDDWQAVALARETLPKCIERLTEARLRQMSLWKDDDSQSRAPVEEEDSASLSSQLRKTKSMDASCLDVRAMDDVNSGQSLSRAKSELHLQSSKESEEEAASSPRRPQSMAVPEKATWAEASLARAMYAYLSSGDNQLSFHEGDIIVLLGDRKKGWQFGENLRTQCSGWFPLAYTELITEEMNVSSPSRRRLDVLRPTTSEPQKAVSPEPSTSAKPPSTTMFGDTLLHRKLRKQNAEKTPLVTCLGPPPALPAPIPELHHHRPAAPLATRPHPQPPVLPVLPALPPLPLHLPPNRPNPAPASLRSSNDSGFSNDPPPQPEIDYSDDDSTRVQKAAPEEPSAPADAGRKELFSSVRGWLLYKSALELWDDVSEQKKHSIGRTLSTRETEPGGTLGRFSSQDLLKPSPIAVGRAADGGSSGRVSVKRTKSLWKFRRANRGEILEGMSLWKHRSLIDVRVGEEGGRGAKGGEGRGEGRGEGVYASAESLGKGREGGSEGEGEGEDGGVDDSSESIIVVNDHVNMGKKKGRCRYNVSNESDITQSDTLVQREGKSETSNSRSDVSDQTETETIGKESYLPRMKLIKSISSETWNHHPDKDPPGPKDFHTWNPSQRPSLSANDSTKRRHDKRTRHPHKEKPNNKLKDKPKLLNDPLRLSDRNATCGPWHDLWALEAPVKS